MFNQIIAVTLVIAVVVVALFFALLTVERVGLYGMLKAIGARSRTLLGGVVAQAAIVALIIATLHVMRPSIVLLTGGLIAAGLGIVLYNIALSGIAIGLLILGFARPAPATA